MWSTPGTAVAGTPATAAFINVYRDDLLALRTGGIAVTAQAALDFLYAASTTQLGRLAAQALKSPRLNAAGTAWEMVTFPTVLTAHKSADESVSSSEACQNDDHLVVAVAAGGIYAFRLVLSISGFGNGGIRVRFASGGASCTATHILGTGLFIGADQQVDEVASFGSLGSDIGVVGTDDLGTVYLDGAIEVNAAGNLQLQWAQQATNVNLTSVLRGSFMTLTKLN